MRDNLGTGRCPRCFLKREACLCPRIPRVETRTRFVLLRHAIEAWKRTNTGRLAALALANAEVHDRGSRAAPQADPDLSGGDVWVLYPDGTPAPDDAPPPRRLVVLDGSWRQVRRMWVRVEALRRLPCLALPAPAAPHAPRLRRQRDPRGMATLEAIAAAVARLEGEEKARPLFDLYAEFVRRVMDDAPPYRHRPRPAEGVGDARGGVGAERRGP